ncbi:MAG: transporter substrate-binding domain-containing protein [Burkholderiaceae bacterium]|jgi:signal transduction histidine kinase|nr:transporter substrate-binding domain-containing protein [Burkholderiaceae bacterium]
MRVRLALLCLFAGLFALRPASAAAPDPLNSAQRSWLASHPQIVLGAGEDWAPWIVRGSRGELTGFAVDHLALINRKLGTQIRIEAGPWPEMVAKAEAGVIDGLTLTAPLEERRSRFEFTEPFFTDHDFFYLRTADQERRAPARLDDLRGRRVGYAKGTLRISRALAEHPGIVAVPVANYAELSRQLLAGDIDMAIASYSLEYWRVSTGTFGFGPTRVVRETDARMVMSIRKDRAELAGILNAGLAALSKDELQPLQERWFGADFLRRTATFAAAFTPQERAWLALHPVIRVGIDPQWAPVEFVDASGGTRGMTLTYLERIGGMLGVRFEVVPSPSWSEALHKLSRRELDLLPAIAANPERLAQMHITEPYLSFPAAIFSATNVAYLGSLDALRGKAVAVVEGEAVQEWLRREWPELVLVPVADTRAALRAMADGRVFAFVGNLVTTSYYIGQSGLTDVRVAGETGFTYRLGMGVRSDWPELAAIVQKAVEAIPAHERDRIYRDWISIRYEHALDKRLLWAVVGVGALLLLAVLVERALSLNRANARLQRLAKENQLAEERERRRLAAELHDSPMQRLALAQLQFAAAARGGSGTGQAQMTTGLNLMREALDELRTLQFELSPPMLHKEGLEPTLRWLAAHVGERSGVDFEFRGPATMPPLPQDVAIALFQTARELAYNVARHARATHASIELVVDAAELRLTIADDGQGMARTADDGPRPGGGGFGLFGVRERLALLGGDLTIGSDANGTRITARMPLRERKAGGRWREDLPDERSQPGWRGEPT